MQASTHRSPRQRAVAEAALAVIDKVGLHGLTIRALARELGVAPMTLYSHFASKNELLDLTFEHLLHRVLPPHQSATWQGEFEHFCKHVRRTLLEHPHWIPLLTRVTAPVPMLEIFNRMLALMRKDGFRPDAAMFAFSSAISLALGSVLVERMMGGSRPIPIQRLELVKGKVTEAPRGTYPGIVAAAPQFDRWSFDNVFDLGVRSLVSGLEENCARSAKHRRRGSFTPRHGRGV